MPSRSQTHIDTMLTNISVKYMQDPGNFIASLVFPSVPVKQQSARYFKYLRDDWFRDDMTERAMGTESAGGDYTIDNTPTYFCNTFAYHKDVYEQDRLNADNPLTPDQDATEFVVEKVKLNQENAWANKYFKAGVWGQNYVGDTTAGTGKFIKWSDYNNSDPIANVSEYATNMLSVTGKRPNTLVIGQRVYDALKQHPDILDRIKFTQKGVITLDLLATLFDIPRILVARAIQNKAVKGATNADMDFICGDNALLCYSTPSPKLKEATAGYTFSWTGLMGSNALGGRINRFSLPQLGIGTERIEVEIAYDMKVVAADMGAFLSNAI